MNQQSLTILRYKITFLPPSVHLFQIYISEIDSSDEIPYNESFRIMAERIRDILNPKELSLFVRLTFQLLLKDTMFVFKIFYAVCVFGC